MRCPDCNRFVGFDAQDPEVELEVDGKGLVTGSVRCALACMECGGELKEANFEVEVPIDVPEAEDGHEHSLVVDTTDVTATESGGGRYKRNNRGFELSFTVKCEEDGCAFSAGDEASDNLPASQWDELV